MAFSFRSFVQVATATALLAIPRGVLADTSLGCVAVSSTFTSMTSAVDNSPDTCKTTCSGGGYTYYGVSQQFCACSNSKPTISQTYDASACDFACSSPNQAQTCGGEDSSTFQFLYNLYEISSGSDTTANSGGASTTAPTTATTLATTTTSGGAAASIPAASTPVGNPTVSSPTDGTSITVTGTSAVSGSALHAGLSTSTEDTTVFISKIDCSCTDSTTTSSEAHKTYAVITSTVQVVETVSCSGAATTLSPVTTSSVVIQQNGNQNGPYSNTTLLTTAKPVSPSITSSSPYASVSSSVPDTIVTAAGSQTFDQVSLMGKEWYLSLIALTVAFVLL